MAFALAQETVPAIARLQVNKVRKLKVVEEEESFLNKSKEMLKQVLEENLRKAKLKSFNCGKTG